MSLTSNFDTRRAPLLKHGDVMHAEFVVARVESDWVWADDGRRFLDAAAKLTRTTGEPSTSPSVRTSSLVTRATTTPTASVRAWPTSRATGLASTSWPPAVRGCRAAPSRPSMTRSSAPGRERSQPSFASRPSAPLQSTTPPPTCLPEVGEVRGATGLLAAIEIAPGILERRPGADTELHRAVRDTSVLVRPFGSAVVVSPPSRSRTESWRSVLEPLPEDSTT